MTRKNEVIDPGPPIVGDNLPPTTVRVPTQSPMATGVPLAHAREDAARLTESCNMLSVKNAALAAVLRRWVGQHAPACVCELCRESREALR